jgi:hypothetical protein
LHDHTNAKQSVTSHISGELEVIDDDIKQGFSEIAVQIRKGAAKLQDILGNTPGQQMRRFSVGLRPFILLFSLLISILDSVIKISNLVKHHVLDILLVDKGGQPGAKGY